MQIILLLLLYKYSIYSKETEIFEDTIWIQRIYLSFHFFNSSLISKYQC